MSFVNVYPTNIIKLTKQRLLQLLTHYKSTQIIDVQLTGTYKIDREKIFGSKSAIKNTPLIKSLMIICGYINVIGYIEEDEEYSGKPVAVYGKIPSRYMFIELASALMARVTNYYQAIQGVRNEEPDNIINDIKDIITELITNLKKKEYIVRYQLDLYQDRYVVITDIFIEQ